MSKFGTYGPDYGKPTFLDCKPKQLRFTGVVKTTYGKSFFDRRSRRWTTVVEYFCDDDNETYRKAFEHADKDNCDIPKSGTHDSLNSQRKQW